jgi:hypothetical protein
MIGLVAMVVISLVVLTRDPSGTLVEDQAMPTSAEVGPLREQALAAATGAFERIEQARLEGDPSLLDGVFVPGGQAEASIDLVAGRVGTVADARVLDLTRTWATVQVDHQGPDGTVAYRVALRRVDDRWLVRDVVRLTL